MKRHKINEPILLHSKENRIGEYISLGVMFIVMGFGFYIFIVNRDVFLLGVCLLYFAFQFYMMCSGDIFVTRSAIYRQTAYKSYHTYLIKDLTYSDFKDEDSLYLVFGIENLTDLVIRNDRQNYKKLRNHLKEISRENLPHHGYFIAERADIKPSDGLGCIECQSQFRQAHVKQWSTVVERPFFKTINKQLPICPNCSKESSVVLSLSGPISVSGLKSMKALRKSTPNPPNVP